MGSRLATLARIVRRFLSLAAFLALLIIVGVSFAGYLTATGRSLPLLRRVVTSLGGLVHGQRTERLTLDVRVTPDRARLSGRATLTVRSLVDGRRRFYFLLDNGLRVRDLRVEGLEQHEHRVTAYQLWQLTVVDVGAPVEKDASLQLTFDYAGSVGSAMFGVAPGIINPRSVLLNVDALWYPNDLQSFFTADVALTLPTTMTVVHNGLQATRIERGDLQRVHWTSARPVAGLSLVAGPYEVDSQQIEGVTYRFYAPRSSALDRTRVLEMMAAANRTLTGRFGPSGFNQVTAFVGEDFRRAFNDGSGLIGIAPRYFRTGDYGFGILAHEIAHNWWGGTVGEQWLSPGTGGEWLVEGFAEFSSLVAAEASYGREALTHRLASEFFDPARQASLREMSVLDNALREADARDTIYRKGAYVASMLRQVLGDDAYFHALRLFLDRFRYQQATDTDLQQVLQENTTHDLAPYFADWVRSKNLADLSLESASSGELLVANLGTAAIPGKVDLWKFKKDGGEPLRTPVEIGQRVTLETDVDYAVLDPQLVWADVERENNRYPRRSDPVYVVASPRGDVAVARGELFPWVRASLSSDAAHGRTPHTWDLTRGLAAPPQWSADAARIILSHATADTPFPTIVTLASDGAQRVVGIGNTPVGGADGALYAARGDRIIRLEANGTEVSVIRRCGEILDAPLPSPGGEHLVYTAARGGRQEIRVAQKDGGNDRVVLAQERDRVLYRWSPDGAWLYAVVGGAWDWQIWQIPLAAEPVQRLVASAAAITDLAVSPTGTDLAFTAAPDLDYPTNRRQLYVMNLSDRRVHSVAIPDSDPSHLTWAGPDTLLVVAARARDGEAWLLPEIRALKRVRVVDGAVDDVQ